MTPEGDQPDIAVILTSYGYHQRYGCFADNTRTRSPTDGKRMKPQDRDWGLESLW